MHKIGQSQKIQQFISDLENLDIEKYEIVTELYLLFSKTYEDFNEKFIYGGIGIYLEESLIGGIWVSKKHVSLVFTDGYKLDDKYKVLEGSGKYRRHIKIKSLVDINQNNCKYYLKQLYNLHKSYDEAK